MMHVLRTLVVCIFTFVLSLQASFKTNNLIIEIDQIPLDGTSTLENLVGQEPEFRILETQTQSSDKRAYLIQAPTDVNKLSTFLTILAEVLPSARLALKNQSASEKTFRIHGFEIQNRKQSLQILLEMGVFPQAVSEESIQFRIPKEFNESAFFRDLNEKGISAVSAKYETESQARSVFIFTISIKKEQNADKFSQRLFKRYPDFKFVSSRRNGDVLNINYRIVLDPEKINVESEVTRLRANLVRWVGVSDVTVKSQGVQTIVAPRPEIAKVDVATESLQKTILHIRPKNKSDLISLESHVQAIEGVIVTSIHEMTTNSMVMAVIDVAKAKEISEFLRAHPMVLRVIEAPKSEVESYLGGSLNKSESLQQIRQLNAKQILFEISCRNYFHGF